MEFLSGFVNPIPVCTVDDEDEALCTRVVVPPEGPDLVLASYVLRGRESGERGRERKREIGRDREREREGREREIA